MSNTERAVRRSNSAHWLIAAFSPRASSDDRTRGVRRHPRWLSSLLILTLLTAACGKIGAPIPPARFTERTSELTAIQRGAAIVLAWPAPSLSKKESSRSYVARADIYRLTEQVDQEPVLDLDDYQEAARVVGFLDRPTIEAQIILRGRLQFFDLIDLSQTAAQATTRLRYAIRYVNSREQPAAFSNTVAVEPAARVALPPTGLQAAALAQDVITLKWTNPEANVDGTQPASLAGYNVYRRRATRDASGEALNDEPITEATFKDTTFAYTTEYVYFVRALSQGAAGLVESADSEPLAYTPLDTFAPEAPNPVSIASANGTMSLFWPSSPERDVIGYNIYRAGSADAPDSEWVKLNEQAMTTVTFHDDRVVIDQSYSYRVTAIDRFNNESAPSKVVSETAHP
ncbi:MAG: fibronectin type III domain-containing protein [Blastocatellia bacterium]